MAKITKKFKSKYRKPMKRYSRKYGRRNRGGMVSTVRQKVVKLEPAALNYLKAITDPFDDFVVPPAVPTLVNVPSQKIRVTARGNLTCDSAGKAWIVMNPFVGPLNGNGGTGYYGGGANQDFAVPIIYNDSSDAVTALTTLNEAIDPANAGFPAGLGKSYWAQGNVNTVNLAYSLDNLLKPGADMNYFDYKLVGAGIRIRYVGREDAKSGRVYVYEDPLNEGALARETADTGLRTYNNMENDLKRVRVEPLRGEHCSVYRPRRDIDLNWSSEWGYTAGNAVPDLANYHVLGIFVDGCGDATNPGKFIWEAVAHYEFTGTLATNLTPTPPDTGFLGKILSLFPASPLGGASMDHWKAAFSSFARTTSLKPV